MPQIDEKHVRIDGCVIVWDGITRPDTDPANPAKVKYNVKVVVPPTAPDLAVFGQLANNTLQYSKFRGTLPAGGLMPLGQTKPGEFGDQFPGWAVISAKTFYMPDVYDESGVRMDPMAFTPLLYGGQRIDILVHCYEYDKAGNRGIATGLDAFAIIASANAQRQDFGGGGMDTASAFGGVAQPGMVPYQQPVAPAPAGVPVPQAVTQAPVTGGFDPVTGQPVPVTGQPVAAVAPAQPVIVGYDPVSGQPIYQQ